MVVKETKKRVKVLAISDTHFPYHSKSAYNKLLKVLRKEQPTHVIQMGDLLDQYCFSKFTRSTEITVEDDIKKGLDCARKMWADVQAIVPNAKYYQLLGNHDVRMSKRIAEKLPELSEILKTTDIYKFPNVTLIPSERDSLEIQGVVYIHGHLSRSLDHARHYNKPVVHGHRHRPIIEFENANLWSMDVGHMADRNSLPLSYTQTRVNKWTMAAGIVENGKPRLVILE